MRNLRFVYIFLLFSITTVFLTSCSDKIASGSYSASDEAYAVLEDGNHDGLTIEQKKGCYIIYPETYKAGFVFYPGGKVEYEAYLPLCKAIAKKGFLTILVHMPADLAIFDINAFKKSTKQYSEIEHWYIGGHSLGGAMAGTYVSNHPDAVDGIVFMAAFSTKKISDSVKVLSIYGTCDGVLNFDSYEKNKANLPSDFKEVVIEGGCHSYFGDYGHQNGDGEPTITREDQMKITSDEIKAFAFPEEE